MGFNWRRRASSSSYHRSRILCPNIDLYVNGNIDVTVPHPDLSLRWDQRQLLRRSWQAPFGVRHTHARFTIVRISSVISTRLSHRREKASEQEEEVKEDATPRSHKRVPKAYAKMKM